MEHPQFKICEVFEFSRYAGLKLFGVDVQRTVGTAVHSVLVFVLC